MATIYVTGPCAIFTGSSANNSPVFLGHAERGVAINIRPQWRPAYSDLGGSVPFDMLYEGEDALVNADVSRYNESEYRRLADRATTFAGGTSERGINDPGEIGSLMLTESIAYSLWIRFPYATKAVMQAQQMPAGYRFKAAYLQGPDALQGLGTQGPRKVNMVFHCLRDFDVSVTNTFGQGQFILYDHDMTGVPPID